MSDWMQLPLAFLLFIVGLRLSAFFSGSETGFYRLSIPRLGIDSRAGDRHAKRLLWYSEHPAFFVATCLIGNNVANYLTTAAISSGVVILFGQTTDTLEIASTLVMSPVIFQFGELLPKTLYYLTPLRKLRREVSWFSAFYWVFLPLSFPLVLLTRLFESVTGFTNQRSEILLGRSRLVQLVRFGHQEGILSELQSRLANGLLRIAPQTVTSTMIPVSRVLGVAETVSRKELLDFAKEYGLAVVAVHRSGHSSDWFGYSYVAENLPVHRQSPVIHPMPEITHGSSKLEALHLLQTSNASYGAVKKKGEVIGVVNRNGLLEQLFRPELLSQAPKVR